MKPEPEILDRNLRALLVRCYEPARPGVAFRERVRHACMARLPQAVGAAPRASVRWRWTAAAAVLVASLGAAWWLLGERLTTRRGGEPLDAILARGALAMRDASDAPWRPASPGSLALEGSFLEVASPAARSAAVRIGGAGTCDLDASGRLRIERSPELTLALADGSLTARCDSGPPWLLATAEGEILLERGVLRIAYEGRDAARVVHASLLDGAARAVGRMLAAGSEVTLRDGAILEPPPPSLAANDRTAVAPGPEQGPAAPAASAQPEPAVIDGQVRDADSGEPLSHFDVTLIKEDRLPRVSEPVRSSFASADGTFVLAIAEPGEYSVFVQAEQHAVFRLDRLRVPDGAATPDAIDVLLEGGGTVHGEVVDAETGKPLEGALVVSERDAPVRLLPTSSTGIPDGLSPAALTATDGGFTLPHLSAGAHVLRASLPGRAPAWSRPVEVARGGDASRVRLELGPGSGLRGTVSGKTGEPMPGVAIVACLIDLGWKRSTGARAGDARPCMTYGAAVTGLDGGYAIADLAPGMYSVVNLGERAEKRDDPVVLPVQVAAGGWATLDFGPPRGVRLSGRLLDAAGHPVTQASVAIVDPSVREPFLGWRGASVQADGRYEIDGLRPGTYALCVGPAMGPAQIVQEEIVIPTVEALEHDLVLPSGELSGAVSEAAGGAPVREPVLILEEEQSGGVRRFAARFFGDQAGRYAVPFLRPGRYRVTCYDPAGRLGQQTVEHVTLATDARASLDFALAPGGSLSVTVLDAGGAPVPGATMSFRDPEGREIGVSALRSTDADGRFQASGLAPGAWQVRATRPGGGATRAEVKIAAGETAVLTLRFDHR